MPTRRTPPARGTRRSRGLDAARRIGRPRGTVRPGARATERSRAEGPAPKPTRFTHRMAVLVLVALVLAVSYASSMRAYLQQRSQMSQLREQIAQSEDDIKALEREKRRWSDDAYVEAQARERFGWVLPGETSYQVLGRDGEPLEQTDELTDPSSVRGPVPDAWWSKVYGSLENADHPERIPVPVSRIKPPHQETEPAGR